MSESLECIGNVINVIRKQLNEQEFRKFLNIAASNKADNTYFKGGTKKLAEFFYSKGYLIVDLEHGVGSNYQLAKQIYAAYPVSWDFNSDLLKRKEGTFKYETKELDNESRSNLRNLCVELQKHDMIDFKLEGTCFIVTIKCTGEQRRYLKSECYEKANQYLIDKTIRKFSETLEKPLGFTVYRDVRLKEATSNDDKENDIQLDFVVEFDDRFYVFETKAGPKLYVDKWVDRTRLFGGDNNKFITCCLQDFNPRTFEPFLLLPMKTLEDDFMALLKQEFA